MALQQNLIEFRQAGVVPGERVSILIDDTPLDRVWQEACGRAAAPLWMSDVGPGLEWWAQLDQLPNTVVSDWVPDEYAPALTCSCGDFGCGGALVRITFDRDLVVWSDFKTANYEDSIDLGTFTFKRKPYEAALRAA